MDWTASIDGYCERLDPSFWAEPLNAWTNLAFLLAAAVMAWRLRGARLPMAQSRLAWALVAVLATIGVGSFLFHTFATRWAAVADVAPIAVFVLLYIYVANRSYWGLAPGWALGTTALFFPYAAAMVPLFAMVPGLGSSAGYAPVALLIALYAVALWRRVPEVARGLAIGAAILAVSITLRSLDEPLCAVWPMGTHPAWHLLNALMLGWMIEVLRRHVEAAEPDF